MNLLRKWHIRLGAVLLLIVLAAAGASVPKAFSDDSTTVSTESTAESTPGTTSDLTTTSETTTSETTSTSETTTTTESQNNCEGRNNGAGCQTTLSLVKMTDVATSDTFPVTLAYHSTPPVVRPFTLATGHPVQAGVDAGSHTLTEVPPAGWKVGPINCDDGSSGVGSVTFTVKFRVHITCVVHNSKLVTPPPEKCPDGLPPDAGKDGQEGNDACAHNPPSTTSTTPETTTTATLETTTTTTPETTTTTATTPSQPQHNPKKKNKKKHKKEHEPFVQAGTH